MGGLQGEPRGRLCYPALPCPPLARGARCSWRSPGLGLAHQHARACSGVRAPWPELPAGEGAGLADSRRGRPRSRGRTPACRALPPGGAIAKRLLPSGGDSGTAAAPRGEAGPGAPGWGRRSRHTARKPDASAPWRRSAFPKPSGLRGGGRPCSAGVGACTLVPGTPHRRWARQGRDVPSPTPGRSVCKDCKPHAPGRAR